ILTIENVPQQVAQTITSVTDNTMIFLLLVVLLLLFIGMFMETNASIIILAPILVPIASEIGVDPVHFGVVMIVSLSLGMVTPPLGLNLFIVGRIGQIRIDQLTRALVPFYIAVIIAIALITFIPEIALGPIQFFDTK